MRLLRAGLLVSFLFTFARPLKAADSVPSASSNVDFGDRFFRGTSPGELPAPKVLVVSTFYAAAIASISVGVASLIRAGNQGDKAETYKLSQPAGFCNDLASQSCTTYRTLFAEEQETRTSSYLLFGAGGLAALSAALTAELWPNELPAAQVGLSFDRHGASLSAQARF